MKGSSKIFPISLRRAELRSQRDNVITLSVLESSPNPNLFPKEKNCIFKVEILFFNAIYFRKPPMKPFDLVVTTHFEDLLHFFSVMIMINLFIKQLHRRFSKIYCIKE